MRLRQANKIIKKSTVSALRNGIHLSVRICGYYYNKHQEDKALNTILKHDRKRDKKLKNFKDLLLKEIKKRLENEYIGSGHENHSN